MSRRRTAGAALERGVPVCNCEAVGARFTRNPILLVRYLASFAGGLAAMRRTLCRLQPDLIHANTVRAGIAATLATVRTKIPIVRHNHDMLPPSHPLTMGVRAALPETSWVF